MSAQQKFKIGDFILWNDRTWLVVNVDDKLYELKLVDNGSLSKKHGIGGYIDISIIDATAKLFKIENYVKKTETSLDNLYEGGLGRRVRKLSLKKRGSKIRRSYLNRKKKSNQY